MSSPNALPLDPSLAALREQLMAAAAAFTDAAQPLGDLMRAMVDDVERAAAEPLEIFPVKHHSPASALQIVRRLRARPPRVIFLEGCEDIGAALTGLEFCRFPVALQAFAPEAPEFPADWSPLNLVMPLTEFSAEYQAIAYCREHPETELVFVDRSADHVFQWAPRDGGPPGLAAEESDEDTAGGEGDEEEKDTANLHGGAVGLRIGAMEPTFDEFLEFLLRNARVKHYSEWWSQYVEGPTMGADYATYRHVFFLVASLLRRIGIRAKDRSSDEQRERYMWAKMRRHLREKKIAPGDALHICGAVHAVSPIPEFGVRSEVEWEIPPATKTKWLYGVVPSSYAAIERQFGLPSGDIAIAQRTWDKGCKAFNIDPFKIERADKQSSAPKGAAAVQAPPAPKKKGAPKPAAPPAAAAAAAAGPAGPALHQFLTRPPEFVLEDDEQLTQWCVDVVRLARKNGYLASTADTIAIHHTAHLLARLRDRPHPSPYDFRDAAVTCLEKDRVPRKRNMQRVCDLLLGGDRLGRVGYESLPPLAQDVYDRLAVLGVNLKSSRIERALLDIANRPELLPASDLLWRLKYLGVAVKPIMGEHGLGHKPKQESWDIAIGKHQNDLIQLGYEGVTVEQVLEKRLKAKAYAERATTVNALEAAEDSVVYLKSGRLARELGLRAVALLRDETGAKDAPEIFQRVRRLVHYYRTVGLPDWIKDFVSTGYQHYSTLLPAAFADRGTLPQQLSAMLAFIFTQEALAFSMGCQRSQLLIAVKQAAPEDPPKKSLLWAAQWVLGLRGEEEIRGEFTHLLSQPLLLPAFPEYVAGFLMALEFTPRITRLAVEIVSRAFAGLPEEVLVPWLPRLVVALRPLGSGVMATLVKEAGLSFPRGLGELAKWEFGWDRAQARSAAAAPAPAAATAAAAPMAAAGAPLPARSPEETRMAGLLLEHPAALDGLAARIGIEGQWTAGSAAGTGTATAPGAVTDAGPGTVTDAGPGAGPGAVTGAGAAPDSPAAVLLAAYPEALNALAARVAVE
ncbi:MAG: hypothetical protein IT372_29320 [Polyangiaceae bacterium]|nr:hypothetical protein [Polyangiaceae bacterium]